MNDERAASFLERRYPELLTGIVIIALSLAMGTFFDLEAADPMFDEPILDARVYLDWAHRIAEGDFLGERAFFLNPLYPYLIAPVVGLAGPSSDLLAIRMVQVLLGVLTALLVAGTARRLVGPGTGLLAGLLTAAWPLLLFYEQRVMSVTVAVFLNALALRLLVRLAQRRTVGAAFLAGLPIGLGILTRPNVALFLVVLPLWLLAVAPRGRRLRFALPRAAALFVTAVLVVLPATVRNWIVARDFVPVTWTAGPNLWQCNNPEAVAKTDMISKEFEFNPITHERDSLGKAEAAEGRELKPSEASRYWTRRTLASVAAAPGAAAAHLARRFLLFFGEQEFPSSYNFEAQLPRTRLLSRLPLRFGYAIPLALLGLALGFAGRRRFGLWATLLFSYAAGLAVFFPLDHYRAPVLPAVLPLAAFGAIDLIRLAARGPRKSLATAVVLLVAFAGLSHAGRLARAAGLGELGPKETNRSIYYHNQGLGALARKDYEEAERLFGLSIAQDPGAWLPWTGLADAARDRQDFDRQLEFLREALDRSPDNAGVLAELARNLSGAIRLDEAEHAARRAVALAPRDAEVRYKTAFVHIEAGRLEEGLQWMLVAAKLGLRTPELFANISGLHRAQSRYEEALKWSERGLAIDPESGFLRLERALANLEAGTGDPLQIREDLKAARKAGIGSVPDLK
jgi:4-amino-4-deoxy-L-arabinose transferase-like glycosyltransferase